MRILKSIVFSILFGLIIIYGMLIVTILAVGIVKAFVYIYDNIELWLLYSIICGTAIGGVFNVFMRIFEDD